MKNFRDCKSCHVGCWSNILFSCLRIIFHVSKHSLIFCFKRNTPVQHTFVIKSKWLTSRERPLVLEWPKYLCKSKDYTCYDHKCTCFLSNTAVFLSDLVPAFKVFTKTAEYWGQIQWGRSSHFLA